MKEKEMKKKAKSEMLKLLSSEMKDMMRSGLDKSDLGKKMKVTVAADSKEGLMKGLSKAEEIMKKKSEMKDEYDMEDEYPEDEECEKCKGKGDSCKCEEE